MSAETKFTPGPWRIAEDASEASFCWWAGEPDHRCVVVTVDDSPGEGICSTNDDGLPTDEDLANAHLIAAAPDLYAALEKAQCGCSTEERESGHRVDCWFPEADAALKKARGEA